jgi:hypothetical protein
MTRIEKVPGTPAARIPLHELDRLLSTLEVEFVRLSECLISPGWQLSFQPHQFPAIHYTLQGSGRFGVGDTFSIRIEPHSLIIVPPGQAYRMDSMVEQRPVDTLEYDSSIWPPLVPGQVRRIIAGPDEPKMLIICGYFRASYGTSLELFSTKNRPIHEKFDSNDQVDVKLRAGSRRARRAGGWRRCHDGQPDETGADNDLPAIPEFPGSVGREVFGTARCADCQSVGGNGSPARRASHAAIPI